MQGLQETVLELDQKNDELRRENNGLIQESNERLSQHDKEKTEMMFTIQGLKNTTQELRQQIVEKDRLEKFYTDDIKNL